MKLLTKKFNINDIKLTKIYDGLDSTYIDEPLPSTKIKDVYGDNLKFPTSPKDRPFIASSFVTSIDGKIVFNDIKQGTLIAKNNFADEKGGLADFWVMNMLRACSDAVILGSGSLQDNPNLTAHIYDEDLQEDRISQGLPKNPINIIVSLSGYSIPYKHTIFQTQELSLIISTSLVGESYIKKHLMKPYFTISGYFSFKDIEKDEENIRNKYNKNKGKVCLIITGKGNYIDNTVFLKILSIIGIKKVSVEASMYTHFLLKDSVLDEIFLNYSGVFVGGVTLGIGYSENLNSYHMDIPKYSKSFLSNWISSLDNKSRNNIQHNNPLVQEYYKESFDSINHPHCRILSIHMHSAYFMYTRQKFEYNI